VFLKTLLKWASGIFENGEPLLDRNPLTTYSPPRERDPKRPMIDTTTVAKLVTVADKVHPQLKLLIVLMETTGRRLSSVLGLRWDDFDFEGQTIHWRPELDKRRRSWLVPMPSRAAEALLRFRAASPQIGSALVFPAPRRIGEPVSVSVAEHWLRRAYVLAGLTKLRGGLWHPFRRKWATERKPYPLRDVAAAGGWSDVQTLLICYQQPDAETLKAVIEGPKLAHQLTQVI
jgi:integrase